MKDSHGPPHVILCKTQFRMKFLGTVTIYLYKTIHIPSSNDPLIFVIKPQVKYSFPTAEILLLKLCRQNILMTGACFSNVYYYANVAFTSEFRTAVKLGLLTAGN